jgi:RHS repeat-associated protein
MGFLKLSYHNAGSELNSTTGNYEMHNRQYDPVLGRMTAVDPMASKYASLTPYNYAFNDPVYFNDPLGDDPYRLDGGRSYYDDRQRTYYDAHSGMYGSVFTKYGVGPNFGPNYIADARAVNNGQMSLEEYAARHGTGSGFTGYDGSAQYARANRRDRDASMYSGMRSNDGFFGIYGPGDGGALRSFTNYMVAGAHAAAARRDGLNIIFQAYFEAENDALTMYKVSEGRITQRLSIKMGQQMLASSSGQIGMTIEEQWQIFFESILSQQTQTRPDFATLSANYPGSKVSRADLLNAIGGKVKWNFDNNPADYANTCAIRMSKALNDSGHLIPFIKGQTGSGDNGNWYFYRVSDLVSYVNTTFGSADITNATSAGLQNQNGIIFFEVSGWGDASGHVDIWNGTGCGTKCYWPGSSNLNGATMTNASLWLLN